MKWMMAKMDISGIRTLASGDVGGIHGKAADRRDKEEEEELNYDEVLALATSLFSPSAVAASGSGITGFLIL